MCRREEPGLPLGLGVWVCVRWLACSSPAWVSAQLPGAEEQKAAFFPTSSCHSCYYLRKGVCGALERDMDVQFLPRAQSPGALEIISKAPLPGVQGTLPRVLCTHIF